MLAAHINRHGTLTEWMDAPILDEHDPSVRDVELDLYSPLNPNEPPYTPEFPRALPRGPDRSEPAHHCMGEGELAGLRAAGREQEEFAFVVHGTMADPRWLDPTVDPNDRTPGATHYYAGPDQRRRRARSNPSRMRSSTNSKSLPSAVPCTCWCMCSTR